MRLSHTEPAPHPVTSSDTPRWKRDGRGIVRMHQEKILDDGVILDVTARMTHNDAATIIEWTVFARHNPDEVTKLRDPEGKISTAVSVHGGQNHCVMFSIKGVEAGIDLERVRAKFEAASIKASNTVIDRTRKAARAIADK